MSAIESLKAGDVAKALEELKDDVRSDPSDARHRIFLFQLFAVTGDWARSIAQLKVAAEMDSGANDMAEAYKHLLQCEALREQVFRGERQPLIFGEPEQWMAKLLQASHLAAAGDYAAAAALRAEAFEEAETTSGTITLRNPDIEAEEPGPSSEFEWIADADSRLGPFLEVIQQGKYYWVPFGRIEKIEFHPPKDLRDSVWMPAVFTWLGGGEMAGMTPTRYPDSHKSEDGLIQLARKTAWEEKDGETYLGLGQRMLTTDADDYPLMDIATITLNSAS